MILTHKSISKFPTWFVIMTQFWTLLWKEQSGYNSCIVNYMSLDENNFADGDDNINDGDTVDILVCPLLLWIIVSQHHTHRQEGIDIILWISSLIMRIMSLRIYPTIMSPPSFIYSLEYHKILLPTFLYKMCLVNSFQSQVHTYCVPGKY